MLLHADPAVIVVGGVSGCGKSTVGRLLATKLRGTFYEGDEYHPPANIAKLRRGVPLTDEDRRPWLLSLQAVADNHARGAAKGKAVIACSALKRGYRRVLRGTHPPNRIAIVMLLPTNEAVQERVHARAQQGCHFMPPALLADQLATLELPPAPHDFFYGLPGDRSPQENVCSILTLLARPPVQYEVF
ncbi:hypothetical protein WJX81_000243 [Elliptochloris bilobata]|uniref:Gluconokinase n=1 Tax=Elliptochloris bilobata TaxID=381761 RepID=A0AAW1S359_9CHLO